jgi:hypothetical protein
MRFALDPRRRPVVQAGVDESSPDPPGGKAMKNLLAFLAAAVLVFLGVGWYLDWFHVLGAPAPSGHKTFSVDVNADKIESDVQKGGEKVMGAIEKARREAEAKAKAEADKQAEADKNAVGQKTDTNKP